MVKKRNVALVIIFTLITFGLYGIYWIASTTNELKELGAKSAPNPWLVLLFLIPVVNFFAMIYYFYKYSIATEEITNGGLNRWLMLLLWIIIGIVPQILVQLELNKHASN